MSEEHKESNRVYSTRYVGLKAYNYLDRIESEIWYHSLKKEKYSPTGFVYGINVEYPKNNIIKQFASDFYGNKELRKTINT